MSDTTGDLTLNSTVAHIHARRENGPRWNPTMSEEENRSEGNLILLCFEHSKEVDDFPEAYPADDMRAWKVTIRQEYDQAREKKWTINEDQIAEVFAASFEMRNFARTSVESESLTECIRRAAMLKEMVGPARRTAKAVSEEWLALCRLANEDLLFFDDMGERLYASPPEVDRRRLMLAMKVAVTEARDQVEPVVQALAAEIHALKATNADLADWADWVEREARRVLDDVTTADLDDVADVDTSGLSAATEALAAKWRGESPPMPPEPESMPLEEVDEVTQLRVVLGAATKAAGPWRRVTTRDYDEQLYDRLVACLPNAATFPPVPSNWGVLLESMAFSAASVLRNADEDVWAVRIEEAANLVQCDVAVTLLQQLHSFAEDSGRTAAGSRARELAALRLTSQSWMDPETWVENVMHARALLDATAEISSTEAVRESLSAAIGTLPPLVVLMAIARWREQHSFFDLSQPGRAVPYVQGLPSWLPIAELSTSVRAHWGDITNSDLDSDDNERRLAAEFLQLVENPGAKPTDRE